MRETRHASRARCRAADTCVCPTMTSLSRRQTPQATRSDARDATRRRACGSREKKKENTRGSRVFRRARTISSLSRFGGGSATFPSSKSASRRSSSFSDVGSCSAAARSTAACDAFSRFRSSSRSFFVAAASLAFPAGVSSPRCFLCVSNARSHFWYSCLSPDASAARASPASSPAAIAAHALARHAASSSAVSRHGLVQDAQIQLLPSEHRPPLDGDVLVLLHELHVLHPERLVLALAQAQLQFVHRLHARLERERRRVLIERDRPPGGRDDPAQPARLRLRANRRDVPQRVRELLRRGVKHGGLLHRRHAVLGRHRDSRTPPGSPTSATLQWQ